VRKGNKKYRENMMVFNFLFQPENPFLAWLIRNFAKIKIRSSTAAA